MSSSPSRWVCDPYSLAMAEQLSRELGVSHTLGAILARRGYETPARASAFLSADESHDPGLLGGIEQAGALVLGHVERGSRIVVHGDYDVDGVCSTAILLRVLGALGASPSWHLPSRFEEGYGLSGATIDRLAREGTDLLVTADCGITALEEIEQARAAGIDVLVTDHHRPGGALPRCQIVHPGLGGYPFPDLCAAAVALKLSEALSKAAGRDPAGARDDLDLAGLATVCDMVPLRGENRRIAREGLAALARTKKPGLRALMRVSSLDPGALDERAAAFRLGPRLNAAGRLKRADAALELLMCDDEDRAAAVADELDLLNRERREQETRALFAADAACAAQADRAAIVVAGEDWNPGVVGIVAARLVERHHRPCVVIALDGSGAGRGSGRSIGAYDLHAGLSECSEHLRRFGGHRAAAGVELDATEVEPFARALARHAGASLCPADLLPAQKVDAVVGAEALGLPLAEELERLRPYGAGNPQPTLLVPAAGLEGVRPMGEERQHARFTLTGGGARARGVAFRTSARSLSEAGRELCDVALRLELNEWNGTVEPRAVLAAACRAEPLALRSLDDDYGLWDAVAHELAAAQGDWPQSGAEPVPEPVDRRGNGLAGIVGELLSSGESTLLVCADAARRRAGLGRLAAGFASAFAGASGEAAEPAATPALVSWDVLVREPSRAEPFDHLVAVDPPSFKQGEALLARIAAGSDGSAHLAWASPEAEFAFAVARSGLDLREALALAYRALRAGDGSVEATEAALRGDAAHPRPVVVCARLVRILVELGLIVCDTPAREIELTDAPRTALERSAAYRAYRELLARMERRLADEGLRPAVAYAAAAG